MSKYKETISQTDFSVGSPRPESAERDDTVLVTRSLKEAENTYTLTTGGLEARPGMVHVTGSSGDYGYECDLGTGRVFVIQFMSDGIEIYNSAGVSVFNPTINWAALSTVWGSPSFSDMRFWAVPDPDTSSILIGSKYTPIYAAVITNGVWSIGTLNFQQSLAGAVNQPFYPYHRGSRITPSARTGSITVTASNAFWTTAHEGMIIRYEGRQIQLDTYVSTTVMNATVIEELPPTYTITVASASGYQKGDAVEHETGSGQGYISNISGTDLTVVASSNWDGFPASDKLIGPNAKQNVSAVSAASPGASYNWDMQMLCKPYGYAGWAEKHKGRIYLCDFPLAPQSFAVSRAGFVDDFSAGENDADGFVETVGSNYGGDLRYIISSEDLLFFTTGGIYYQQTRDGSAVTPRTISPIHFSNVSCHTVPPVAIDDGCVFIDSVGKQAYATILSGDVYRSWMIRNVSEFHAHLINNPVFIGATAAGSVWPEQFVFVTNGDGTIAVCQWSKDENIFGWRKWTTTGTVKSVYQAFGEVHAIVDRDSAITSTWVGNRTEKFVLGCYLDAASGLTITGAGQTGSTGSAWVGGTTQPPTQLISATAAVYIDGWDLGDYNVALASIRPVDEDGNVLVLDYPGYATTAQIGLPFTVRITPWARRSTETTRGVRQIKRVLKVFFTVQDTLSFTYEGRTFGGYRANEDLTVPPPLRTEEVAFLSGGRGTYVDRPIVHDRPGPLRILKIKQRVTV